MNNFLIVIGIIGIISLPVNAQTKINANEDCIGDLCIYNKYLLETIVVKQYGIGNLSTELQGEEHVHIYYDKFQKLWVRIEASSHGYNDQFVIQVIYVSLLPMCKDTVLSKKPFPPLRLEKKLKIGLKESEVLSILGQPGKISTLSNISDRYRVDTIPGQTEFFGSKVYYYSPAGEDSLLFYCIYFKNGIATSFQLSCSE